MRTTIDLPDALYRKTKAAAALRGTSMKRLIVQAVEANLNVSASGSGKGRRVKLPILRSWKGQKLDLSGFDFDQLLG